jgi:hypothetical protein
MSIFRLDNLLAQYTSPGYHVPELTEGCKFYKYSIDFYYEFVLGQANLSPEQKSRDSIKIMEILSVCILFGVNAVESVLPCI